MALLKRVIREKFARIDYLEKKCLSLFYRLNSSFTAIEVDVLLNKIEAACSTQNFKKERVLNCKLLKLYTNSKSLNPTPGAIPFLNLSNKTFTERESKVLMLGPKYVFKQGKIPVKKFVPQIESILANINTNNKEELRFKIYDATKKFNQSAQCNSASEMSVINDIKKDDSIRVLLTDKSNKIAVLNTSDYEAKMMTAILDMDCTEIQKNPINKIMAKAKQLIKDGTWPEDMKSRLKLNDTAVIPLLFGRIKDHKENCPLRPIVSKCMGPTYGIEKAISLILRGYLPASERVIGSTSEFIQKIKNMRVDKEQTMASFDIISLYPSIDVYQAIVSIDRILEEQNCVYRHTIVSALNLIADSNYFQFCGRIFKQVKGAPMGSPLSAILAEFVLRPIEDVIHELDAGASIKMWLRYVDDVFIVWSDTRDRLLQFKDQINSIDHNIKFTIETEESNSINFLDVNLVKKKNGTLERKVYRKPTAVTSIIPRTANAPNQYKMAAFHSYLRRAQLVCSKKNLAGEIKIIEDIAEHNGYSKNMVRKLRFRLKNGHTRPVVEDHVNRYAGSLSFYPGLTHRIQKLFSDENYKIGITLNNQLFDLVRNDRDKIDPNNRNGVYEIPFTNSNNQTRYYIGMTKRKLITRKKEHQADIRYHRLTTALARLNNSEIINIDFDGMKIVAGFRSTRQGLMAEAIEILTRKTEVCNEEASVEVPRIWLGLLRSVCSTWRTTDGAGHQSVGAAAPPILSLESRSNVPVS